MSRAAATAEARGLLRFGFEVGPRISVAVAQPDGPDEPFQPFVTGDGRCGLVLLGGRLAANMGEASGGGSQEGERLLERYRTGGEAALTGLPGDHLLCLWDEDRDLCIVSHGLAGTRPLFVRMHGTDIAFASEARLLSEKGGCPLSPDDALQFLLTGIAVPGLDRSHPDDGVRRLDPGMTLRCQGGVLSRWLPDTPAGTEGGSLLDRLADVVGPGPGRKVLLLSGGLHAGILAAALGKAAAGDEPPPVAWAFGFPGLNEFPLAGAIADRFGLKLETCELSPEAVLDAVDGRLAGHGLPVDDLLLFLLCAGIGQLGDGPGRVLAGIGGRALFGEAGIAATLDAGACSGLVRGADVVGTLHRTGLSMRGWDPTGPLPAADESTRLAGGTVPLLASVLGERGWELDVPFLGGGELAGWAEALRRQARADGMPVRRRLLAEVPAPLADAMGQREPGAELVTPDILLDGQRDRVLDRLAAARGGSLASVLDLDAAERRITAHYDGTSDPLLVWRLFLLATWSASA
ncbi:hypothetical protein J2848_006739 [Azospirillum lipoferum]|uniref:Glutamine amidotransferase type-2 domain-containing protein n=1 Tax=Azospirillum lipoferum TaxID=193 RepID=A0A5A9GH85_AZOLI|nr:MULTISPECIES: hypothetical protein [Azospirillum]KAA0593713.1 hypothetical protein FZ942_22730 [Azospirillum lipoferum]MCP1615026.1 hypothetical protein [Azospirillum lipoferum]MDW5536931.1 hypothetical protein [Azospirillum sp. NL1]